MAKCMEIHKPLLYNYWAEECSIKIEKPISVIIDRGLLEELELIITGQDPEKARNTNDISVTNEREEQIFEGLEIIFGIEIKTELDKARDMLTENGMKIEVTLDIEVLQPGEGFSMIDYKEKEQLTNRTILAEIKMIIEKNIKGEVAVTRGFLNNVPRRFVYHLCCRFTKFILGLQPILTCKLVIVVRRRRFSFCQIQMLKFYGFSCQQLMKLVNAQEFHLNM